MTVLYLLLGLIAIAVGLFIILGIGYTVTGIISPPSKHGRIRIVDMLMGFLLFIIVFIVVFGILWGAYNLGQYIYSLTHLVK
jgi:uncharacterized iron-regulated membrane protein